MSAPLRAAQLDTMRTPPHSVEAEQAVLGSLMLDNATWERIADRLREDDFYRQDHRLIFRAISELSNSDQPFDAVTLSEWLQSREQLETAGGLAYLATLAHDTPTAANVRAYADIVHERAVRRDMIRVAGNLADASFDPRGATAESIRDNVAAALQRITTKPAARTPGAVTRQLADIPLEQLNWLWPGRIPVGKLTILSGDPGLGKSLVTLAIAAAVSRGAPWPCHEGQAQAGDVLLISAEDDAADTIRPRMEAAGADLRRIHVLDGIDSVHASGKPFRRPWSFTDSDALSELLENLPDCRLVIIDPLSAYLSGTDSHKNSDVRALLAPLADMASRRRVAVLCVSHLNKSVGPAMYRTSGSLAFVAAARSVYAVAKDQNDPSRRLVVPVKCNLGPDTDGLAYRVGVADNGAPVVQWESEPVTVSADEALSQPVAEEDHDAVSQAEDWLKNELSGGPKSSKEIKSAASDHGPSWAAIRRAQNNLRIRPTKTGSDCGWVWSLPQHAPLTKHEHIEQVEHIQERQGFTSAQDAQGVHVVQGAQDAQRVHVVQGAQGACRRCGGEGCRWCKQPVRAAK